MLYQSRRAPPPWPRGPPASSIMQHACKSTGPAAHAPGGQKQCSHWRGQLHSSWRESWARGLAAGSGACGVGQGRARVGDQHTLVHVACTHGRGCAGSCGDAGNWQAVGSRLAYIQGALILRSDMRQALSLPGLIHSSCQHNGVHRLDACAPLPRAGRPSPGPWTVQKAANAGVRDFCWWQRRRRRRRRRRCANGCKCRHGRKCLRQ